MAHPVWEYVSLRRKPLWRISALAIPAFALVAERRLQGVFIDQVIVRQNLQLTLPLIAAILGLMVAGEYSRGALRFLRAKIGLELKVELREHILSKVLKQRAAFFRVRTPGELVALLGPEIGNADYAVEAVVLGGISAVFTLAVIAVCFTIDPALAPVALIPIGVAAVVVVMRRPLQQQDSATLGLFARMMTFLKLRLSHVLTVQSHGREVDEVRALERISLELGASRTRREELEQRGMRLFELARRMTTTLLLCLGGARIIHRSGLTVGALIALNGYAIIVFDEMQELLQLILRAQTGLTSLERLYAVRDEAADPRRAEGDFELGRCEGRVEAANVTYLPAGAERPLLDKISFAVQPSQLVAIVGPSGSGKSTLLELVRGSIVPTSGSLRIDGHEYRRVRHDPLRRQFGIALQEAVLFSDTIAANVRYGRPTASDEDVRRALEAVGLLGFVESLPEGLSTVIGSGDGGRELSGGQRQRLALARVLLRDAPVLLLDEVTSHLDANSAREVQAAIEVLRKGRTTIIVTHDLTTFAEADQIWVMDGGRIVARGRHAALLRDSRGLYRSLFERHVRSEDASRGPARARP